jgi:hypothetical protein
MGYPFSRSRARLAAVQGGRKLPTAQPCPIAVSDAQLSAILTAAAPLQPFERSAFLAALAARLRQEPEPPGDGALHRIIREVVREVWKPPAIDEQPRSRRKVVGEPIA